ncbi:MAG: extracellular solute-binding protein [Bacilli bacterium]
MNKLIGNKAKFLLTLGAVAVLACACGENTDPNAYVYTKFEGTPSELSTTITWWNNYKVPADGDTEENRKGSTYREYFYALDLISEFNKLYPNIKVETVNKGSYSEIQKAVNTGLNSGDTPNFATCYGDHVAGYSKVYATMDMSGFMDDETIGFGKGADGTSTDTSTSKDDFSASYLNGEKSMYTSKTYESLPYSKSAECMAINKSVFDKVGAGECGVDTFYKDNPSYVAPVAASSKAKYEIPTNWTDLIKIGRQMKTDFPEVFSNNVDSDGYFTAVPICYDSAENMFISFANMMNIPYTSNESTEVAKQILFNNEAAKKLVVQLKKWNNEGILGIQNTNYLSDATKGYHQYSSTMMTAGSCFVCFSSTAGARYFADYNGGFTADIVSTPTIDDSIYGTGTPSTEPSKVISQGPSLTFFRKADKKEEYASWLFYKFLTNTTNSATLAKNTAYFPLRASSYKTDTVKTLTDAADDTLEITSSYSDKVNTYTGKVLDLNSEYSENDRYIYSPVFDLSSASRTAIGNLMSAVFNDHTSTTDAEITAFVEKQFTEAYKTVVTE